MNEGELRSTEAGTSFLSFEGSVELVISPLVLKSNWPLPMIQLVIIPLATI